MNQELFKNGLRKEIQTSEVANKTRKAWKNYSENEINLQHRFSAITVVYFISRIKQNNFAFF